MSAAAQPAALVQEQTHRSQVMASDRTYRVYLPPAYATARTTRYPVIYWFHGYEAENPARTRSTSRFPCDALCAEQPIKTLAGAHISLVWLAPAPIASAVPRPTMTRNERC